jgi:hypothetical protein
MKKFKNYLFRALPALAMLIVMVSSACSASTPSPATNEIPQGNVDQGFTVAPPYMNPDNWAAVPRFTVQQLKQKMDNKAKFLLVDVRYQDEFAEKHLPGAVLAPLGDVVDGKWLPTGGTNDEIILY